MISGPGALAAGAPVFEATPARERDRGDNAPLLAPPPALGSSDARAAPDPLVEDDSAPAVILPEPGTAGAGSEGARAAQARPGNTGYREPSFAGGAGPGRGREVEADAAGVLFGQLQDLQQEVMMLRGVVEGQQQTIERLEREQRERYLDLDRRLARGAGGVPELGSGGSGSGSDLGAPGAGASDERAAYEAAFALTREREFEDAIEAFRALIDDYPDGQYTPNAWYWLGELYLALPEQNLEQARQAFVQVESQWPGHQKTPDALYKLGIVHDQLGEQDRAREYLQRVRQQHEGSSAARLAGTYLEQL